jgi:hypothetical protein
VVSVRIGSLFSGAGGLDMAVENVFGGETVWHCELDSAASKVLAARWPGVPNLGDITAIDWEELLSRTPDLAGTQRMYDLYCQGLSLEQVAEREGVSRQTVFTRFKRQGLDMRPRPTPKPFMEYDGRRYTLKEHGYYRATSGDREYLHRAIWMREVGPIPDDHDIHHVDHDKTHNEVGNFECLSKADHARLYSMGCNQFGHKCRGGDANASFAVDLLTAGWP